MQKRPLTNPTLLLEKSPEETRDTRDIPQHNPDPNRQIWSIFTYK